MATLKDMWDYPNNPSNGYMVDSADWSGDESYGMDQRISELLDGSYKSWPNLDPVVDLGQTVDTANRLVAKYKNYLDSELSSEHLSFYKIYRSPIVVATKKLIDSETITSADVDTTSALITLSGTHEFEDGMLVYITGMNGSWQHYDDADYYASDVDNSAGTLKLRVGSPTGPYLRFYNLENADITAATAATPCVFTDASHDLSSGTLVSLSGFDGTIAEHNGSQFYAQVIDASTFNLSWDSGGSDLLSYQTAISNISIDEFRLQEDGSIIVKATNTPTILSHSEIEFDTGGNLQEEIRTYAALSGNVYVDTTATTHEYKIYTDQALTTAIDWTSDLNPTTFDQFGNTVITGLSNSVDIDSSGRIQIPNKPSTTLYNTTTNLDGYSSNTFYYTDSNGSLFTDSGLTTYVNSNHLKLTSLFPVTAYEDNKSEAVSIIYDCKDNTGTALGAKDLIINVTGVNKPDITGLTYQFFDPGTGIASDTVGTLTDTGNQVGSVWDVYTYSGATISLKYSYSGTVYRAENNPGLTEYDVGENLSVYDSYTGYTGANGGKAAIILDTATSSNELYNQLDSLGSTKYGSVYIASTHDGDLNYNDIGKTCIIPTGKYNTGTRDFYHCLQYTIDADGNPDEPASLANSNTNGGTYYWLTSGFENPVYTNGTSSSDTFSYYPTTVYTNVVKIIDSSAAARYKTGTIVTMNGSDYVLFYMRTYWDGSNNNYEYLYFPWDGTSVDFASPGASIGGSVVSPATGSTNQVTYFTTNGRNPNGNGSYLYFSYLAWPGTVPPLYEFNYGDDGVTYVACDPDIFSGTTLDVIQSGTVDSTTGSVAQVRTPDDDGQKQRSNLFAATTGTIAPNNDPYKWEIDTVSIKMPGALVYSYQDSSNVQQFAAQVDTSGYWSVNGTSKTLYATTGETPAQFTVGVDGTGYLNSISLTEEVDAEGRYADGGDIVILIQSPVDQYIAPTTYAEDVWDTDDEWDSDGQHTEKVWPYHVRPIGAKVTVTQPSSKTVSQNGTKYVRSSGVVRNQIELTYPPMTHEDFREFEATAQAARGQATPFYLRLNYPGNERILFHRLDSQANGGLNSPYNVRLRNDATVGDKTLLFEGFPANQTNALVKGEAVILETEYGNGGIVTVVNDVDSNKYGEAKFRIPYAMRTNKTAGITNLYKNPYWAIVTLADDDFEYNIGTDGLYRLTVRFDFDEWKAGSAQSGAAVYIIGSNGQIVLLPAVVK